MRTCSCNSLKISHLLAVCLSLDAEEVAGFEIALGEERIRGFERLDCGVVGASDLVEGLAGLDAVPGRVCCRVRGGRNVVCYFLGLRIRIRGGPSLRPRRSCGRAAAREDAQAGAARGAFAADVVPALDLSDGNVEAFGDALESVTA